MTCLLSVACTVQRTSLPIRKASTRASVESCGSEGRRGEAEGAEAEDEGGEGGAGEEWGCRDVDEAGIGRASLGFGLGEVRAVPFLGASSFSAIWVVLWLGDEHTHGVGF